MPLNFPTGPTSGATYTYGGKTWQWNTYAWDVVSPNFVNTLNGATGNLSITGSANQVTVNTSSPQIVVGLPNNLIVGNLTVTGSLLVSGGITTQISEVVLIEDNIIVLNANVTGGSPTENAGIQVSRGASAAVQLLWNETTDKWSFTNDGSQYYDLPVNVVNTVNGATGNIVSIATTGSNVFTGLNTFNAGISANSLYANGITFGSSISSTDSLYFNLNEDRFTLLNVNGSNIQLGWTGAAGANINISNDGESAVRIYGDTVTTTGTFSGATASFTGLVSSSAGFSGAGSNLTNIVKTFNGLSGAVSFAVPLATTGSTGVASFHFEDFTVGATGHVRIKTGINATNIIVLGSGGTGGIGKLPAVDGSALLEVNAAFLNGKTNSQITDGGTF
jgi:hypothetical protein